MATGWPVLKDVRTHLRLQPDPESDAIIDTARLAAIEYVNRRTNLVWTGDPSTWLEPLPDALFQAAIFQAGAYYKRRDTVDGTIGWGDQGVARVAGRDPHVEQLIALFTGSFAFG